MNRPSNKPRFIPKNTQLLLNVSRWHLITHFVWTLFLFATLWLFLMMIVLLVNGYRSSQEFLGFIYIFSIVMMWGFYLKNVVMESNTKVIGKLMLTIENQELLNKNKKY